MNRSRQLVTQAAAAAAVADADVRWAAAAAGVDGDDGAAVVAVEAAVPATTPGPSLTSCFADAEAACNAAADWLLPSPVNTCECMLLEA